MVGDEAPWPVNPRQEEAGAIPQRGFGQIHERRGWRWSITITRQNKTRQSQDETITRRDKTRHDMTRQDKTITRQDKTRQDMT